MLLERFVPKTMYVGVLVLWQNQKCYLVAVISHTFLIYTKQELLSRDLRQGTEAGSGSGGCHAGDIE